MHVLEVVNDKPRLPYTPPKYVMSFLNRPNKRVFKIVAEFKDDLSIGLETAELLKNNFKMLSFDRSYIPTDSATIQVTYFVEALSNDVDISEVKNTILSFPSTLACDISEGHNGLLLDERFPIRLSSGAQGMIIPVKAFQGMVDIVRTTYGSGGEAILHKTGFESGSQMGRIAVAVLGIENLPIHELMKEYAVLGHGRAEIVSHSEETGVMVVRIWGNVECADHISPVPYSQFTRGHLCGFLGTLTRRKYECEELKCMATGNEDYCQFKLVPKK